MSFRYRFSLLATILPSAPEGLVPWIESCIAGAPIEPSFEVPAVAAGMAPEAAWLLGAAEHATVGSDGDLSVLAMHVHDDDALAVHALSLIVGPYCAGGTIAVLWTDMGADDPTLFSVQDGVVWVGGRNGVPVPAVDGDPGGLAWRLGTEAATVEACARLGLADAAALVQREASTGEPVLARRLLARSVLRALRDAGLADVAAARQAATLVLDLLDAGGDPVLVADTPGWQLQEVAPFARYRSGPTHSSGRVITAVAGCFDEVGDLDAGPRRFVPGEVVTVLAPLPLTTRDRGTVEVLPGTRLEVTKVYDKGHAECRPVDGDGEPLCWIRPEDEGRLFRRS